MDNITPECWNTRMLEHRMLEHRMLGHRISGHVTWEHRILGRGT
jgi:hypothetical protein